MRGRNSLQGSGRNSSRGEWTKEQEEYELPHVSRNPLKPFTYACAPFDGSLPPRLSVESADGNTAPPQRVRLHHPRYPHLSGWPPHSLSTEYPKRHQDQHQNWAVCRKIAYNMTLLFRWQSSGMLDTHRQTTSDCDPVECFARPCAHHRGVIAPRRAERDVESGKINLERRIIAGNMTFQYMARRTVSQICLGHQTPEIPDGGNV